MLKTMSNRLSIKTGMVLLMVISTLASLAQTQTDSLSSYLEVAAKNNPGVMQKFYEYQASLQKIPQVGSLPDPELTLGFFLKPMELIGGKQVSDFRLMQMFPWSGTLNAAKDEMSQMAKARYAEFNNAKNELYYNVRLNWAELLRIREKLKIAVGSLDLMKVVERLAIEKYKNLPTGNPAQTSMQSRGLNSSGVAGGTLPATSMQNMGNTGSSKQQSAGSAGTSMPLTTGGSDLAALYRIQLEIQDQENTIASYRNQLITQTVRFNKLLNRPAESNIILPDSLVAVVNTPSPEIPSDSLLKDNPMLEMLRYEKKSLEARKNMVTRMGYPMVGLGLNYSIISKSDMSVSSMNGKDMIMPMVAFTLPVYRKKYKAMKSEAELLMNANDQQYNSLVNDLQTDYSRLLQDKNDAERKILLFTRQMDLSQKTLEIMIRSFSVDGTGLSDILKLQQDILVYKESHADALTEYNIAVAGIEKIMATLRN